MLSEPTVLMILPGCLVLLGMITGFVLWSWARGVDNQALEDLHDDIRRLGNRVKQSSVSDERLLDLQFENDELRVQCEAMDEHRQLLEHEIKELRSVIRVFEAESVLAEQTILKLRDEEPPEQDSEEAETDASLPEAPPTTYQFIRKTIFRPELADLDQKGQAAASSRRAA